MAQDNPYSAFNFLVEIDGVEIAGFSEVSGLSSETDVIEYREGNDLGSVRKLPGLTRFGDVILTRGVSQNRELSEWREQVVSGEFERRRVAIVLLGENREPVARWEVFEAWPSKWTGPDFNAISSSVAIEEMVLANERIIQA